MSTRVRKILDNDVFTEWPNGRPSMSEQEQKQVEEHINDPIADYWDLWDIPEEEWVKATTEKGEKHMEENRIKQILDRRGGENAGLVATCEICKKRGGGPIVPFIVDYWPCWNNPDREGRAYRCLDHEPGTFPGDKIELQS